MTELCEVCKQELMECRGPEKAIGIVIAYMPGIEEYEGKIAFSSANAVILRNEMARHGVDLFTFRRTYIWRHLPPEKGRTKIDKGNFQQEFDAQMRYLSLELINRSVVLLLGTDVTEIFLDKSATEISGIPMKSTELSAPLVMGTLDPSAIEGNSWGEFALGIEKFCIAYNHYYHTQLRRS